MKLPATFVLIISSLLFTFIAGCSAPEKEKTLTPVSIQLKWVHQGQFAGFYVAKEKGFYANEGLDVTLLPGGPGVDINQTVLNGTAQFGDTRPENLIVARTQGESLKAIGVIVRGNPYVLVALPESGIRSPRDFVGKTIMPDFAGNRSELQFLAVLRKLGLSKDDMTIVPYNADYKPFLNGEVDVIPAYSTGDLFKIQALRPDVTVIWPSDYGISFYADTLFTTDELIENDPDLVLRIVRATMLGHQYAIDHPDEATELTLIYTEDQNAEAHKGMITSSVPLIYTGEDEVGWMRGEIWSTMQDILFNEGMIQAKFSVDEFFDNSFIEETYSK